MNNIAGVLTAVILVILIIALGWVAYTQGYLTGQQDDDSGIEVNLGGLQKNSQY